MQVLFLDPLPLQRVGTGPWRGNGVTVGRGDIADQSFPLPAALGEEGALSSEFKGTSAAAGEIWRKEAGRMDHRDQGVRGRGEARTKTPPPECGRFCSAPPPLRSPLGSNRFPLRAVSGRPSTHSAGPTPRGRRRWASDQRGQPVGGEEGVV